MISKQLKKLKKSTLVKINYSKSEDLDPESLLDLIPNNMKRTKYLSTTSLHFQRLRLTSLEEIKFNKKFKEWLKTLIVYGNQEGYEYLLDFLIRKYHIIKYNERELLFLTFPFPKYYTNNLKVFEYLGYQKTYSTEYIAECCAKYIDFFHFVIDFFDFYEYLQTFLDEIVNFFLLKNKKNLHKHVEGLNEILEKLNKDLMIVKKINIALNGQLIIAKNIKTDSRTICSINYNEEIYKNNEGRNLLNNLYKLEDYFNWLKLSNLMDENFSVEESELLFFVFFGTPNFVLKNDFMIYKKLVEEINPKERLFRILYEKFKENLVKIDKKIYNFYDKDFILNILDKDNYKSTYIKDYDILAKALYFDNFDAKIFHGVTILEENLINLIKNNENNKLFMMNLRHFCSQNNLYNDFVNSDMIVYKTLAEIDIKNCKNSELVLTQYKLDKEVIKRITNFQVIYDMCYKLGFKEILDNFDLQFILVFSKHIDIKVDFLQYIINRFDIEKILLFVKDHSEKLIHFIDHKDFNKFKVIMKETIYTNEHCYYIIEVIFNNIVKYKNHLDLLSLYKIEYKFINKFKDLIFNSCTNNLDFMDFLISSTDYEDIRVINKISPELIKKQKRSILILFEKYGNVMALFIKDFIMYFDYSPYKKDKSLLKLNPNLLLKNIFDNNKADIYEYQIIQILKHKTNIDFELFKDQKLLNTDIVYAFIKHKFIHELDWDVNEFLSILYNNDVDLFMKLTKFYDQNIKDIYFNKIINEKNYDKINKQFSHFNLSNENILYELLQDYLDGQEISTQLSILSNNSNNIKELNLTILENIDTVPEKTLLLISKMLDNNTKYDLCHKKIHESILLLLDSRNENIRTLSRNIYDKLIK